jgi:geranylgeranyl diphosphate synthase type II
MAAESHSNARAALDRAAGAKAEELAQITDFIATRTS